MDPVGSPGLPRTWARAHRRPVTLILGLLLSAWAGPVRGQAIHGQVLDRETRQGVEGALVLLLDEAGGEVDGFLTDGAGRFHLQASGPGSYALRAERIGYETVTSEVMRVGSAPVSGVLLETGPLAVELEDLRVEGEQRCVVRPGEGLEMARVWEEARKALTVQEWTEEQGLYRFRLLRYQRDLHPQSRSTLSEERESMVFVNRNPVRSLPARELLEEGFIRTADAGGYVYYGPDASVLLSDLFLDTHCFRLSTSTESPEMLGLSFEPIHGRSMPDIVGTLWLDRATADLVQLDYSYDWAPWAEVRGVAEGRVEFQKMPSGAFIVRKWWIRMPSVGRVRRASSGGYPALELVAIREVGSEVADVTSMDDQVIAQTDRRPRGFLRGSAWDSIRSRPLSQATVYLSGTQYDAPTDDDGHFAMERVAEGIYSASLTHPSLDSLGIFPQPVEVRISAGDTVDVQLALPSPSTFLASVCGPTAWEVGDAVVTGTVRREEGGGRAAGATVSLEWSRDKMNAEGQVIGRVRQDIRVVTDARGRYRGCGIPPGAKVTAQASMDGSRERGTPREVEVAGDAITVLDLTLSLPPS